MLLSVTITAGPGGDAPGAVGGKLRLLVSPVKPRATQLGAPVPPYIISVFITMVAPLLKFAWPPPPKPTTQNSAIVQPDAAFTELSPVPENTVAPPAEKNQL